jgi:hypothetical protein
MAGTASVDALIAVNRNILDGLRAKPENAPAKPKVALSELGTV